jgi:hypothetical protein
MGAAPPSLTQKWGRHQRSADEIPNAFETTVGENWLEMLEK